MDDSDIIVNLWETKQRMEDEDFAYSLTEEERSGILKGIQDIEEGRTFTHHEVMKKFDKWK